MKDLYGREIEYLRVSLTELCNLRCRYCMPVEGVNKKNHDEMLTEEELLVAVKVAVSLGIKKIRLTGGEPLVKKNIIDIVEKIKMIDGVKELCLTTNGTLLSKYARDLKRAGLDRINISLDTLDPKKYNYITRLGNIEDALEGIKESLKVGFDKVKINTVLIGGFNDDEVVNFAKKTLELPIDIRFIELMPMYDSGDFNEKSFMPCKAAFDILKKYCDDKKISIEKVAAAKEHAVAILYKLENAKGHIGFISPVSCDFCKECNRIRLTADGKLKPCLHSSQEICIKGLNEEEIREKFIETIKMKPERHARLSYKDRSEAKRNMNEIGG